MVWDAIAGAVAGSVVSNVLGGGGTSQATASQPVSIPGTEFQPVTYTTTGGSVTGTQQGDYGYNWSADVAPWIKELGALGSGAAKGLFENYLAAAQQDSYKAADEYYQRGYDVLAPEFKRRNIALQERMFGSGRLGQIVGGVNPDAYSENVAQQETLAKLYADSLSQGQAFQTNQLNMLSNAAAKMQALGLTPMEIENQLINQAAALEAQRSNAMKQGTQSYYSPQSTQQATLAGQIGGLVGTGVTNWMNSGGNNGLFSNYSVNPTQMYNNYQATGSFGGNFGYGTGNSLMTSSPSMGSSGFNPLSFAP